MSMTAKVDGKKLVVEIDCEASPRPSVSGKTLVVASSHGNQATTATMQGKPVVIGLNAYIKR